MPAQRSFSTIAVGRLAGVPIGIQPLWLLIVAFPVVDDDGRAIGIVTIDRVRPCRRTGARRHAWRP